MTVNENVQSRRCYLKMEAFPGETVLRATSATLERRSVRHPRFSVVSHPPQRLARSLAPGGEAPRHATLPRPASGMKPAEADGSPGRRVRPANAPVDPPAAAVSGAGRTARGRTRHTCWSPPRPAGAPPGPPLGASGRGRGVSGDVCFWRPGPLQAHVGGGEPSSSWSWD